MGQETQQGWGSFLLLHDSMASAAADSDSWELDLLGQRVLFQDGIFSSPKKWAGVTERLGSPGNDDQSTCLWSLHVTWAS